VAYETLGILITLTPYAILMILYYAHLAKKAALLAALTSYTVAPQQSARYF